MSLQDFLTFLGRPGAAVRSGLTGNYGGTVRNLAQVPLDALDAFLPGDLLPDITKPEDAPEFADVLAEYGMDMKPGLFRSGADIVGGIATDPLTFLPPAMLAKGLGAAGRVAQKAADAADSLGLKSPSGAALFRPTLDSATDFAADTFNWSRATADQMARLRGAQGQKAAALLAAELGQQGALVGLDPTAGRIAVESIHNVSGGAKGAATAQEIIPGAYGGGWKSDADWLAEAKRVARSHPEFAGADPAQVDKALESALAPGIAQRKDLLSRKIWNDPDLFEVPGVGVLPTKDAISHYQAAGILQPNATVSDLVAIQGVAPKGRGSTSGLTHGPYAMLSYLEEANKAAAQGGLAAMPDVLQSRGAMSDRVAHMQVYQKGAETDLGELLSKRSIAQANLVGKASAMEAVAPEASAYWAGEMAKRQANHARLLADPATTPKAIAESLAGVQQANGYANAAKGGKLMDDTARTAVDEWIRAAKAGPNKADRDFAVRAEVLMRGMPERSPVAATLARWSREIFKKPATVGGGLPNLSFPIRNRLGAIQQSYNEASSRVGPLKAMLDPAVLRAFKDAPSDMLAWGEALAGEYVSAATGKPVNFGAVNQKVDVALRDMKAAFAASGGNSSAALVALRKTNPVAAEAVENGVINGFASHEEMVDLLSLNPTTMGAKAKAIWDAPAKATEALENRMRLGTFMVRRANNESVPDAVARTMDNLLDYTTATPQNRAFRDFVPFGAFLSQTMPQVVRSPVAISSAVNLIGQQPDEPVMPFMKDKVNIPMGEDELGNLQYLTSLGSPVESVGQIPMSIDEILPKGASALHPVLRTGIAALTGEDPVFGSAFGGYDKTPAILQALGYPEKSEIGRQWNILQSAGLTAPFAPIARPMETLMDERLSPGQQLARLVTGARVQSVDPNRAEQAAIKELLRANPQVSQHVSFYQQGADPEIQQMLDDLKASVRAAKERAKRQGAQ